MRSNINIRPLTPVHGTFEPGPDTPVHYMSPVGRVICGVRGPAHRVKSRLLGNVTCSSCLKLLNLPAPSQRPPCGSPETNREMAMPDETELSGTWEGARP